MAQATCKEEYISLWDEYVDGLKPAMYEVDDDDDREDMKNIMEALKLILAKSAQEMQDNGQFD